MIAFLADNGWAFDAEADVAEPVILRLAAGQMSKPDLTNWLRGQIHEKPRIELRDFFSRLTFGDMSTFVQGLYASGQHSEMRTTLLEAAAAIPCIESVAHRMNELAAAGKQDSALHCSGALLALASIYRAAEEMGYEW